MLFYVSWLCLGFFKEGLAMNLLNGLASHDLTKAQGSYFQAAQFSGMLRCSLYGDISQITFSKLDSPDILVRNQNGSRIWDFTKDRLIYNLSPWRYTIYDLQYTCGLSTCSKNFSQVEAIEITIYSGNLRTITLNVEGAMLYQCRNSTYVHETNAKIRKLMLTLNDENKCGWFSKDLLSWTSTLVSSVLSLFLIAIYVIKCWKKLKGPNDEARSKETHSKTMSPVELGSSHQGFKIQRNVTDNNYETPHRYTEI